MRHRTSLLLVLIKRIKYKIDVPANDYQPHQRMVGAEFIHIINIAFSKLDLNH